MQKKLLIVTFIFILMSGFIFSLFNHDEYSLSERRKLQSFPELYKYGKFNEDYFEDLDLYLQDHFVARDFFRKLKIDFVFNILGAQEYDDVYRQDGYLFESQKEIDEASIDHLVNIINKTSAYFESDRIYFMPIPNKSSYITNNRPTYAFSDLYALLNEKLDIEVINISNELTLDAYYRSDIHLKQDGLSSLYKHLKDYYPLKDIHFNIKHAYDFYGGIYAKVPLKVEIDELNYLVFDGLEDISVFDLETNKEIELYNFEAIDGMDPYDFYLYGPKAYLEINNPHGEGELVVFRDSYGSSIVPLLIPSYKKITVIDLRYYASDLLNGLSLNKESDVLYIYGSEVLLNSFTLK